MKYRKKPVVIEALQYTGDNKQEILKFTEVSHNVVMSCVNTCESYLTIFTLEGKMKADVGDWIIKGIIGEFYPCKPDIFKETYEAIK